jgi:G3E family GTPase
VKDIGFGSRPSSHSHHSHHSHHHSHDCIGTHVLFEARDMSPEVLKMASNSVIVGRGNVAEESEEGQFKMYTLEQVRTACCRL